MSAFEEFMAQVVDDVVNGGSGRMYCGAGFFASDGTVHDCSLNEGHTGPHRFTEARSGREWVEA